MAFWFWVVILSILGLGIYEVYFRYKERNNPLAEEPAVEEETAEVVHAELARATMKIAVLESRLEASEAKLVEDESTLAALEERYQEQLVKTERAYQRQMVTLSERLAANGNGLGGSKSDSNGDFPVRMAAEVAAWRASLGGQPLVDPVVSEDMAALAENNEENIEAQNLAIDALSEETAVPINGTSLDLPQETEISPEVIVDAAADLPLADLAEKVEIVGIPLAPEKEVLDQVFVWDEGSEKPVVADDVDSVDEIAAGSSADSPVIETEEPLYDEVEEAVAADDVDSVDEIAAGSSADSPVIETEEAPYDEVEEAVAAVEEIPPLENRWPDLESAAMQRIMTRQLGSEMDADYLDDDEFLREMGIEGEAPLLEDSADDIVEVESWITDPLEEMAHHINGSEGGPEKVPPRELLTSDEPGRQTQKITDHMWEEMIFSSTAEQEGVEADLASAWLDSGEMAAPDEAEVEHDEEEAAIAAAVVSILSRAPDQGEAEFEGEPLEQEESGSGDSDTAGDTIAAAEDIEDEEPQEPAFVWERQPVAWQGEYFDNTALSDAPVVVRQDGDIDFEWFNSAPVEGLDPQTFSVRWSGNLPLDPGQYRFTASAPDGLRLWLNDRLVISAWYDQSEQTYQREFAWRGGSIDVRVEHYENGGNAKAFLTWDRIA